MKVLVVDPDDAARAASLEALLAGGLEGVGVRSGVQALVQLRADPPQVVVVDRAVTDTPIEGFLAATKVRHPSLLLIATAAAPTEEEYARLLSAGAAECVVKSEARLVLVPLIHKLLGQSSAVPAEPAPKPAPTSYARESPRFETVVPVGIRVSTWEKYDVLYTENLSRGGVFVVTPAPLPRGFQVQVRLGLPDGGVLELHGEVAHVRTPEDAARAGKRPGMGIRLDLSDELQKKALAALSDRAARLGYKSDRIDAEIPDDADDPFA